MHTRLCRHIDKQEHITHSLTCAEASVCPGLQPPARCIVRRWPASALRLTNGPRRATQDSIHHGCPAMNITQTGTRAHKSAAMRAGCAYAQSWPHQKANASHHTRSLEFSFFWATTQTDKVGWHKWRTHTMCVMSLFISTDWFYSRPCVFIHHKPGSHLLPFALSVKSLISSIHLSEQAAAEPRRLLPNTVKPFVHYSNP